MQVRVITYILFLRFKINGAREKSSRKEENVVFFFIKLVTPVFPSESILGKLSLLMFQLRELN